MYALLYELYREGANALRPLLKLALSHPRWPLSMHQISVQLHLLLTNFDSKISLLKG